MEARERKILQKLVGARVAFAFSNFEPWDGTTLEHKYQAAKTHNVEEKRWVLASHSPGEAKRRGRRVTIREDWDKVKISVMALLLRQKFEYGTQFAERLMGTQDEVLVEWNTWHDVFWGRCVCDRCDGAGLNWLGVLLMERRKQLFKAGHKDV